MTGDDREQRLIDDLGRLARDKRARGDDVASEYRGLDSERAQAMLDALEAEDGPAQPAAVLSPKRPPQSERRIHAITAAVTALAAAAAVVLLLRGTPPTETTTTASVPASEGPASPLPFGSWRIDGGGPRAVHQGPAPSKGLVCSSRPLELVLALTPGEPLDRSKPLELVLVSTPVEGQSTRHAFVVDEDDRLSWTPDGGALVLRGTLESLAPLSPGPWTIEPRVGPPGACTSTPAGPRCTSLGVRAIEVDGAGCG